MPAPHGGASGGFIEGVGLPKTINFNFEYLSSGRPEDTYANVYMVKQS
jgi:hypothetical protein